MYKLIKSLYTQQVAGVTKSENGLLISIPFDPANTDYQAYLAWLAEGNVPLEADA